MDLDKKRIAMAYDAVFRGAGGYGRARLADETGRGDRTVDHWCEGECSPSLVEFRRHVRLLRDEDPKLAVDFVARVLAELGIGVYLEPGSAQAVDVALAAMDVAAESGELVAAVMRAVADGRVTAAEDAEIANESVHVQRAALRARASSAAAQVEPSLIGVKP